MWVDNVWGDFMNDVKINVFPYREVLDTITQGNSHFTQSALHAVVKNINNVSLHLKFLCGVLRYKQTAF